MYFFTIYLCALCCILTLFIERHIHHTRGLLVVATGPNKVLTFAGGPVVYEHEWNQIPSARREQPYMSAITGIIHESSHLALLFLGLSIVQAKTRWRHSTVSPCYLFLNDYWDVSKELDMPAGAGFCTILSL